MKVHRSGENLRKVLNRPPQSHPYAHGSFGFWVIQRKPASPIGWVLTRSDQGVYVFDCYAYCRDEANKRPWLSTHRSLNSAVAWMMQHEREIREMIDRLESEPT